MKQSLDITLLENLTPLLNIWMNNREKDYYALLGKYLVEKAKDHFNKLHPTLFSIEKSDSENLYRMLSIYFMSEHLDYKSLTAMYGKPICHSHFGEGFQPSRKYDYCSYLIKIENYDFHIGFDHRGTRIEVPSTLSADKLLELLKLLVDTYCEKFVNIVK